MSHQLPAEIAEAIERLAQSSRTEGYAMSGGTSETEAQVERNANSARLALDAVILKHIRGEWRPIESAPRDGTWVLLTGGRIEYGWYEDAKPEAVVGQAAGEGWQFAWYDSGYYGEYESPTHWRPLPALPTDLGRSALAEEGR